MKEHPQHQSAGWRLLAEGLRFPEGPAFDSSGALWCVEMQGGCLVRWRGGAIERFETRGAPNGLAISGDGSVWFCASQQGSIRRWDGVSCSTMCNAVDGEPLSQPNDLCFDHTGNLLFTCPGYSRTQPVGYVCCLSPDGSVRKIADGMYFPNGLAVLDGGSTLVIAETYSHRLWKGCWDSQSCSWSSAEPWCVAGGPVGPDGLALGPDGLLYVAVYGQRAVRVVESDGSVVGSIQTPGANPTNLAFDPSGRSGLVLTEAEQGCLWSYQGMK